jgi:hypothetical protein
LISFFFVFSPQSVCPGLWRVEAGRQRRKEICDGRMYNKKWVELPFCLPQKLDKKQFLNILS